MTKSPAPRLLAILALLCCACVAVHAQPQPTLSLDFANGINAIGADGKAIAPRVEGKAELADGKFGKAFKSGPSTGYLRFPTAGILSPSQGTVEMWVCPLDWSGTEQRFHVFFDVRGQGALYLYKFLTGNNLLMLSAPAVTGPYDSISADIAAWKPGEWHFIAGTWSRSQQCLYVDGKLAMEAPPNLPGRLDAEFMIGDNPWGNEGYARTSSSLIDRVRIYNRALSAQHIAAHYAGDYNKTVPISEKTTALSYTIDPKTRLLTAQMDVLGADMGTGDNRPQARFAVGKPGETSFPFAPKTFNGDSATADLSLAALPPGDYELRAEVTSGATVLARQSKPVPVPSLEWMGNTLGLEDKVLPPWTPLAVKRQAAGFSVNCWGRSYQFGNDAWPMQMTSQDKPLLARPISLHATVGGQPLQWTNGATRLISATPTTAEVEGNASAATAAGPLRLKTHFHIEYDGLLLMDAQLEGAAAGKIETMSLDLPVQPAVAMYRHRWTPKWEGFSGNVPAGDGVVDNADFLPFAWLGDNDRGLFWFCETGQYWPNYQSKHAYETVREGGAVTMRLNLLDKGQTLPANWRYECGLQATPVKPVPRDWRKWRLDPAPRATVDIVWPTPTNGTMKYFGSPIAADPPALERQVKELHAKGLKAIPYSWLTNLSDAVPEWPWFGSQWQLGGVDTSGVDIWHSVDYVVNPNSRSYSDYVIWVNHQFLQRFNLDGYYHDQTSPYSADDERAGFGWRDAAGAYHAGYPILGFRALYRRLYAMVKTAKPDAFLIGHMSGKLDIPVLAYEDAYLDGEHFHNVVKDSYPDVLPPDAFRAEYMGRQWGIMPYFLPAFYWDATKPEEKTHTEPTRGMMAMLMVHDTAVWPLWCREEPVKDAFDALDSFGYEDSDFIPYFDATPPATTDLKDIYVSVYKRRDGRALAIIANLGRTDRTGTVRFNPQRIGLPLDQIISWPDKGALQHRGVGEVSLTIPERGYRMLLIGKPPQGMEVVPVANH